MEIDLGSEAVLMMDTAEGAPNACFICMTKARVRVMLCGQSSYRNL